MQGLFAKLWVTFIILREMARLKAPLDDLHLVEFEGRGLKADEFRYLAQRVSPSLATLQLKLLFLYFICRCSVH